MMRDKIIFSVTGKLQELLLRKMNLTFKNVSKYVGHLNNRINMSKKLETHMKILSIKSMEKTNIQMKETRNGNRFWEPDLEQIMKGEDFH